MVIDPVGSEFDRGHIGPRLAVVSERLAQSEDPEELPQDVAKALHKEFVHSWVAAVSTLNSESS